jgi:hypothetical protein
MRNGGSLGGILLVDRLSASTLRETGYPDGRKRIAMYESWMRRKMDAGLSAVPGAGRDVFYGEFAGAAIGYIGTACGCVARSGTGDAA